MRSRPWPLVLLALIQGMSPLSSVLVSAWMMKVSPWSYTLGIFSQGIWPTIDFFLIMPMAGVAVYKMKPWSYPTFIAAIGWVSYGNYLEYLAHPEQFPMVGLLLLYAMNLLVVGYFLLPAVRATYFDASVRWWEADPRFIENIGTTLFLKDEQEASGIPGMIKNISRSGAFLEIAKSEKHGPWSHRLPQAGEKTRVDFKVLSSQFSVEASIVYIRVDKKTGAWCFGVRFDFSGDVAGQRAILRLCAALDALGVCRIPARVGYWQGLWDWFKSAKTAQAWIPNLPDSHPVKWQQHVAEIDLNQKDPEKAA